MSAAPLEFDTLIADLLEGGLTAGQHARLQALLRDDRAAQRDYARLLTLHAMLELELNQALPPLVQTEAADSGTTPLPRRVLRTVWDIANNYIAVSLLLSAIFMAIFLLSLALIAVPEWRPSILDDQPSVEFVAEITATHEATWDKSSDGNFKNLELLAGERLVLNSGLAEVKFASGAFVAIEGPTRFTVQDNNTGRLSVGSLVARVEGEKASGFEIATPHARIVDRGTEFGVEAQEDGTTEVAVLTGNVDVVGDPGGTQLRLRANQGASIEAISGKITRREEVDAGLLSVMRQRLNTVGQNRPHAAVISIDLDAAAGPVRGDFPGSFFTGTTTVWNSLSIGGRGFGSNLAPVTSKTLTTMDGSSTLKPVTFTLGGFGETYNSAQFRGGSPAALRTDYAFIRANGEGGFGPQTVLSFSFRGLIAGNHYDVKFFTPANAATVIIGGQSVDVDGDSVGTWTALTADSNGTLIGSFTQLGANRDASMAGIQIRGNFVQADVP